MYSKGGVGYIASLKKEPILNVAGISLGNCFCFIC